MNRYAAPLGETAPKRHRESAPLAHSIHSFYARQMVNAFLSIGMIAGFALLWGAWRLWQQQGLGQKVWLMVAAALVIFGNVAIWTVPDHKGQSLAESGQ
jgi:hypothetical protein